MDKSTTRDQGNEQAVHADGLAGPQQVRISLDERRAKVNQVSRPCCAFLGPPVAILPVGRCSRRLLDLMGSYLIDDQPRALRPSAPNFHFASNLSRAIMLRASTSGA